MKFSSLKLEPVGLRPPEAAQFLGVSVDILERARANGLIKPAVTMHGITIYEVSDLRALWEKIKRNGLPEKKKQPQYPAQPGAI